VDPDTDPLPVLLANLDFSFFIILGVVCILLILSALISGSEVAFFSLSPGDKEEIELAKDKKSKRVLALLNKPKRLLATILIANNFINVGIVILSSALMADIFAMTKLSEGAQLAIQVGLVTFIILLVGEVVPKVYATQNGLLFAKFMSGPITVSKTIFKPLSYVLVNSTAFIDKRIKRKALDISVDHLEHALELTAEETGLDEKESQILKGIVKFGNTDVKQIMTSRLDTIALCSKDNYHELIATIVKSGYSRIPVFGESIDAIEGVLYVKDLLKYIDESHDFKWQQLLRKPFFVPENKKIDDLLKEFQESKVHMAIVVDEYGGTSGIVTFEDIIEEIVGEISDEFDDDDIVYSKIDAHNFVFEGKTPLNDVYRILDIDGALFEEAKGESDTLAGFLIEISGKILTKNEKISYFNYDFTIEAADRKRIKQIKMTVNEKVEE